MKKGTGYPTPFEISGDKGIRTPDLTGAIRALYQLSYIPNFRTSALTLNPGCNGYYKPWLEINRTMGLLPLTVI